MGFDIISPLSQSIVSDFSLFCGREKWKDIAQAVFFLGASNGALILAVLGDRFGKRPLFLGSLWCGVVLGITCSLCNSIQALTFVRYLSGVFCQIFLLTGYVLSIEIFAAADRTPWCVLSILLWSVGFALLDFAAYFVRRWRHLYLIIHVPFAFTICYYWLIPESPYWLFVRGQHKKINEVLEAAYDFNRIKHDERIFVHSLIATKDRSTTREEQLVPFSLKQALTSIPFVYAFVASSYILAMSMFMYFGLTFSSSVFSDNRYLNFLVSGLIEMPSYLCAGLLVGMLGRKRAFLVGNLLASVHLTVFGLIVQTPNTIAALNVINHISKFAVNINLNIAWLYLPEIFPTKYRQFGFGGSFSVGRLVTALSPFLKSTLIHNRRMAMMVGGVMFLTGGLITIFLPDAGLHTIHELSDMKSIFQCSGLRSVRKCNPDIHSKLDHT